MKLLGQHSKQIAYHSKISRRKLLKERIDICAKIFPDVTHQTENFLGDKDLFTMESLFLRNNARKKLLHFEQLI